MKPIIGITVEPNRDPENDRSGGKLVLNWNYTQIIADAGGVPILIPPTADPKEIAKLIDGWLIPGGLDIDASHFGEENHPEVELQDPSRFAIEKALYRELSPEIPVLGICYGCQFLNIARGGSLFQHVPDVVGNDLHGGGNWEEISIEPSSRLAEIAGNRVRGRSFHHQALDRIGSGLKVIGKTPDGIVEAIEATDRPWMVAVQWHPERSYADEGNRRLVESFIAQARKFAEARRVTA